MLQRNQPKDPISYNISLIIRKLSLKSSQWSTDVPLFHLLIIVQILISNLLQCCLWSPVNQNQSDFTNFQCLYTISQKTQFYLAKIPTLYLHWNCIGPSFYQRYLVPHFTARGRPSSSNKGRQSSCLQGKKNNIFWVLNFQIWDTKLP